MALVSTRSCPSAREIWATIVRHRHWVMAYLMVNALDSLTTVIGLNAGAIERNPVHAALMEESWWISFAFKYVGVCLAIAFSAAILPRWRMALLKLLTVLIGIVVILNLNVVI